MILSGDLSTSRHTPPVSVGTICNFADEPESSGGKSILPQSLIELFQSPLLNDIP